MGAGASSIMRQGGHGGAQETGLGDLPESCIAEVMRHLDPPGICKLAKLSRTFRGAASGDFVWESKLPRNYQYLMEKASDEVEQRVLLSKKEIYAQLCCGNRFDGGGKEFWLDKYGGRLCMSISSKALLITGIDDRRYWNNIPTEESRFRIVLRPTRTHPVWVPSNSIKQKNDGAFWLVSGRHLTTTPKN